MNGYKIAFSLGEKDLSAGNVRKIEELTEEYNGNFAISRSDGEERGYVVDVRFRRRGLRRVSGLRKNVGSFLAAALGLNFMRYNRLDELSN